MKPLQYTLHISLSLTVMAKIIVGKRQTNKQEKKQYAADNLIWECKNSSVKFPVWKLD